MPNNRPIDEGDLMKRIRDFNPPMYKVILDLESDVYLRHDHEMLEIAELKTLVMSGNKAGIRAKLKEIKAAAKKRLGK